MDITSFCQFWHHCSRSYLLVDDGIFLGQKPCRDIQGSPSFSFLFFRLIIPFYVASVFLILTDFLFRHPQITREFLKLLFIVKNNPLQKSGSKLRCIEYEYLFIF